MNEQEGRLASPTHSRRRRAGPYRCEAPRGGSRVLEESGCYVYLLVHDSEGRFKIGLSSNPIARLRQLPEAHSIDFSRSARVRLPTMRRASQVERGLHKALHGFRLVPDFSHRGDGATEWFGMAGLRAAINMLAVIPLDRDPNQVCRLENLDGHPYLDALAGELASPAQERRQRATDYNLQQMAHVVELLATLFEHVPMQRVVRDQGRSPVVCLRFPGMKHLWQPPRLLSARYQLGDSSLWELQTGKSVQAKRTLPLVRLIRYLPAQPSTLELELTDSALIRKLPAGLHISTMWAQFLECVPWHRDATAAQPSFCQDRSRQPVG